MGSVSETVEDEGTGSAPVKESGRADSAPIGFDLVRRLALELGDGDLDLPALPTVVVEIREALDDPNCCVDSVTRVVSTEPALAAQLLRVANSALLSRGGKPVTEVRTAVSRMGLTMVRNTGMAYAMKQLSTGGNDRKQLAVLKVLWQESVRVAAIAYVLASYAIKRARTYKSSLNSDEALLAGLLHNTGRVYITSRMGQHAGIFDDVETYRSAMDDWHAGIARAIIESWENLDHIAHAVEAQDELDRQGQGPAGLADIVIAARAISRLRPGSEQGASNSEWDLSTIPSIARIGLTNELCRELLDQSVDEINALSGVLRDAA